MITKEEYNENWKIFHSKLIMNIYYPIYHSNTFSFYDKSIADKITEDSSKIIKVLEKKIFHI